VWWLEASSLCVSVGACDVWEDPSSWLQAGQVCAGAAMVLAITEINRIRFVLFDMQNKTFGPYLAAIHRILISVMCEERGCPFLGACFASWDFIAHNPRNHCSDQLTRQGPIARPWLCSYAVHSTAHLRGLWQRLSVHLSECSRHQRHQHTLLHLLQCCHRRRHLVPVRP
jgi:hypothetical protein